MKPDCAIAIVQKLRQQGHEAFWVGGCVRDRVMKMEPADYDIATSARPEEVQRIFPRTRSVGAQFGVILVIEKGHAFEVATFRSDEAYVDGRRPTAVTFTDARQDVLRRDFTINGLLYDPVGDEVIDYVGGQADITARIVRAIGDPYKRFDEDKLRILRAIRFGARLGYTIDSATWSAVCQMAPKIHQVSRERIREELERILTEGQAAHGVQMLSESGLLEEILPELIWSQPIDQALKMLHARSPSDFAMAVLLHETPAAKVQTVMERLKFSRAEIEHGVSLVSHLHQFAEIETMPVHELKRFFRLLRFEDYLELARIHGSVCRHDLSGYEYASRKLAGWSRDEILPAPLITGDDLLSSGLRRGPIFKEILTRVENEQLEGRLISRDQALAFVEQNYRDAKR